jgi:hypothetical protein
MSDPVINNGGPAFPLPASIMPNGHYQWHEYGMSLRQWFEGQAISGLCANPELFKMLSGMRKDLLKTGGATVDQCDQIDKEIISAMAKGIADSMIGGAK